MLYKEDDEISKIEIIHLKNKKKRKIKRKKYKYLFFTFKKL